MKQTFRLLLALTVIFVSAEYAFGQTTKYPYVLDTDLKGPVIVSRDARGGVATDVLDTPNDRIAMAFQVDISDKGDMNMNSAATACTDGWRLPSRREMQLIWIMGGAEESQYNDNVGYNLAGYNPLNQFRGFAPLMPKTYSSSTPIHTSYVGLNMTNGATNSISTDPVSVRCVRDYDIIKHNDGITYTKSSENSILVMATADTNDGSPLTYNEIVSGTTCMHPYRIPSQTELQLLWIYKDGFHNHGLLPALYWSAKSVDDARAWYVNIQSGMTNYISRSEQSNIRCVRDNNSSSNKKYPYIDTSDINNGPIIVSQDSDGGVNSEAIAANGIGNKVSPKLQVRNTEVSTMIWSSAISACESIGWRMPTQRELMLIWTMGGSDKSNYTSDNQPLGDTNLYDLGPYNISTVYWHWTATPVDKTAWAVLISNGAVNNVYGLSDYVFHTRCVRDR